MRIRGYVTASGIIWRERGEVSSASRKIAVRELAIWTRLSMIYSKRERVRPDTQTPTPTCTSTSKQLVCAAHWSAVYAGTGRGAECTAVCPLALCHEARDPAIRVNMNRFMHLPAINRLLLPFPPSSLRLARECPACARTSDRERDEPPRSDTVRRAQSMED